MNCNPERSLARFLRQTQSKDLRLHFGIQAAVLLFPNLDPEESDGCMTNSIEEAIWHGWEEFARLFSLPAHFDWRVNKAPQRIGARITESLLASNDIANVTVFLF